MLTLNVIIEIIFNVDKWTKLRVVYLQAEEQCELV